MSDARSKPATFHAQGRDGRWWRVRVTPLGLEMLTDTSADGSRWGHQRKHVPWADLLPVKTKAAP